MAKKETEEVQEVESVEIEEVQQDNVNITIEQICAAIINTYKTVVVPMDNLLKDYSNKNIAVTQDEETKILTFSLADNPPAVEVSTEETPAETE